MGGGATRLTVAGLIGGTASELGGGKFANGARSAAFLQMTAEASQYYEEQVGQKADIRSGVNVEGDQTYDTDPVTGRQPEHTERWNVIGNNNTTSLCHQGNTCSQVLNVVPGMNATARLHDYWFNKPGAMPQTTWNNVWTMAPAAAISYAAVIGNVTQGWQNNHAVWDQIINSHRYRRYYRE